MAATFPDADLNARSDGQAGVTGYVSIHTADPGTTGASEATGGSPAYARQAPTFNAAGAVGPLGATDQPATPGIAYSDLLTFDLPAGTYPYFGTWSALTGGTFHGGNALSASQVLGAQGQIQVSIGIPVTGV